MPNYSNSIIYVIMDKSTTQCYIGSTVRSLAKRMYYHQTALRSYNRWVANGKNGKKPSNYCSAITILQRNNYVEYELERFPCKTKKELVAREGKYIDLYKREIGTLCINKLREGINVKDNRQAYNKQYNNSGSYTCPDCDRTIGHSSKYYHMRTCKVREARLQQEQATTELPTTIVPHTTHLPYTNSALWNKVIHSYLL
jgi:hypothetical protein